MLAGQISWFKWSYILEIGNILTPRLLKKTRPKVYRFGLRDKQKKQKKQKKHTHTHIHLMLICRNSLWSQDTTLVVLNSHNIDFWGESLGSTWRHLYLGWQQWHLVVCSRLQLQNNFLLAVVGWQNLLSFNMFLLLGSTRFVPTSHRKLTSPSSS